MSFSQRWQKQVLLLQKKAATTNSIKRKRGFHFQAISTLFSSDFHYHSSCCDDSTNPKLSTNRLTHLLQHQHEHQHYRQPQSLTASTTTIRWLSSTAAASAIQVSSKKKGKQIRVCYGCGADIVPKGLVAEDDSNKDYIIKSSSSADNGVNDYAKKKKSNYWADQKELLRKSKIKNWSLCPRCQALSQKNNNASQQKHEEASTDMDFAPGAAMEVFRAQVQQVRRKHAVVVFVVDAINPSGTIFQTLRDYVGGNPIVLAVTRCDLLPQYAREALATPKGQRRLKHEFAQRAKNLNVAEVFLISLPPKKKEDDNDFDDDDYHDEFHDNHAFSSTSSGVPQLAAALLRKRHGRDVYVVGAANIGKSTLTDALVDELLAQQSKHAFRRDGSAAERRMEAIQEMRVTQSALPGTTLQNIRVPCFVDHTQALWDTPGLLLDVIRQHFPIRNLDQMLKSTPSAIGPIELATKEKKFMVELYDETTTSTVTPTTNSNDDNTRELPLLRMVVRLKREPGDKVGTATSAKVVWNSVFGLTAKIVEYTDNPAQVLSDKEIEMGSRFEIYNNNNNNHNDEFNEADKSKLTPEERQRRKQERRKAYEAQVRAEQQELGMAEWRRRQDQKRQQEWEQRRKDKLAKLYSIERTEIAANHGTDIAIGSLGWLGFVCDRTALVEVYAPSKGVRVSMANALALPAEWNVKQKGNNDDDDEVWDEDEDFLLEDDEYGYYTGHDYGMRDDSDYEDEDDDGFAASRRPPPPHSRKDFPDDPWAQYAGSSIGWEFDNYVRFSKTRDFDGWYPIPNYSSDSESQSTMGKEEESVPETWNPPLEEQYQIEYPLDHRSGGSSFRRGRRRASDYNDSDSDYYEDYGRNNRKKKGGKQEKRSKSRW